MNKVSTANRRWITTGFVLLLLAVSFYAFEGMANLATDTYEKSTKGALAIVDQGSKMYEEYSSSSEEVTSSVKQELEAE